jgi:dihydroneopterin aldolase
VAQLKSTKEQLMVRIDFYKGVFDEEQKERQKIEFEFKQLKATYDELKRQNDIHKQL